MDEIPEKVLKRADSLAKSSRSGLIVSLIGVAIPFLAFIGALVGFGYQAESRKLLDKYPDLDGSRRDDLADAIPRFRLMGIVGAVIALIWVALIAGIILSLD